MAQLRLRELAEARGLTMSQVQRQTGLTIGQIRRYWYNETSQITLDSLDVLAQLLEVDPGDLLVPGERQSHEKEWTPAELAREVGGEV